MTLRQQLSDELARHAGLTGQNPRTISLSGPDQVNIAVEVAAVDSMSCAIREIRLTDPALANVDIDALKAWAEQLCSRITYLLENIGPLEVDADSTQILIRSTPPDQQQDATTFYEIILQSHSNGQFSLRRYRSEKGRAGRDQVDIQCTHEVLHRLVDDLVVTRPSAGTGAASP